MGVCSRAAPEAEADCAALTPKRQRVKERSDGRSEMLAGTLRMGWATAQRALLPDAWAVARRARSSRSGLDADGR